MTGSLSLGTTRRPSTSLFGQGPQENTTTLGAGIEVRVEAPATLPPLLAGTVRIGTPITAFGSRMFCSR